MALARWEPFREISRMQDELNRFFDDRLWRMRDSNKEELGAAFMPAVDVYEDQDGLVLSVEVPGMEPKDVDLRIENGVLTLRGERKLEREDRKENYLRVERSYGTFARSFSLPPTVDAERVKADYKNGVLRVQLPKREEAKPRSIKVKVE